MAPITTILNTFDYLVFGATGDLSLRKLLPSLYLRDKAGQFTPESRIIGISRSHLDTGEYRAKAEEALHRYLPAHEFDAAAWSRFRDRLSYACVDATSGDGSDRPQHFRRPALLQDVAHRSGAQQLLQVAVVGVSGERDDLDLRARFANGLSCAQTVHARHRDIHDDHVGTESCGLLHGRLPVGRLGHDLHIRLRVEDGFQPFTDRFVIVGEKDAQLHQRFSSLRAPGP